MESYVSYLSQKGMNFDMKKIISAFLTIAIVLTNISAASAANLSFSDISGHWAEDIIIKWKNEGIISGYSDGTFRPDNPVTRAELAVILTLAFDLQKTSPTEYSDTNSSAWYYSYLESSARYIPVYPLPEGLPNNLPYEDNINLAKGDGNGFLPNIDTLRMHVAEALVKIKIEREDLKVDVPSIEDVADYVWDSFKDEQYELFAMHSGETALNVQWMFEYTWLAKKLDVMTGDSDGYFRPYDKITRAELLTIIDRILS